MRFGGSLLGCCAAAAIAFPVSHTASLHVGHLRQTFAQYVGFLLIPSTSGIGAAAVLAVEGCGWAARLSWLHAEGAALVDCPGCPILGSPSWRGIGTVQFPVDVS